MRNFEFVNAPTTERAIELLGPQAKLIAGGTDLLDELKEGLIAPERLVNLKANRALKYLRFSPSEGLRLGALTTLSELETDRTVREHYPMLAAAVRVIASPQIRNMATVGGNLCQRPRCWYYRNDALHCTRKGGPICYAVSGENQYHAILGGHLCFIVHPSDLAPALMAYDARISYAGPGGRKTLPLGEFFVGPAVNITRENLLQPNEVVEEISLPTPAAGTRGVYLKVRDRNTWDFATLSVAAVLEMDGATCRRARIVLGAVAPVPWPAPDADKVLTGARITPEVARRAADAALRGARPMSHNAHKVPLAKNLVRRAILKAAGVSP
ncbi:MAG: xanthine dehydrogenase family protein subunit M [Acidobacteria bacterium]|nr:xanthine dehydrogenase family protein subunit M [Acidobacteriota bacterium]